MTLASPSTLAISFASSGEMPKPTTDFRSSEIAIQLPGVCSPMIWRKLLRESTTQC